MDGQYGAGARAESVTGRPDESLPYAARNVMRLQLFSLRHDGHEHRVLMGQIFDRPLAPQF